MPRPCRRTRWLLAGATLWLAVSSAAAETIKIGGTGAALGTMRALAAEFAKAAPAHSLVVVPSLGGGGGMKALAAGAIDIAVVSRPLKAEELAQGLVGMEYGKTALVIATSTQGAGTLKTLAELAEVYAGRNATWADGSPIRVVLRPQTDSHTQLLEAFSPEMKRVIPASLARPGIVIASTDQEAADYIQNTAGAVGVTSLALVLSEKRKVHVLPLGGVPPNPRTLADGSYPYVKVMVMARKDAATPAVARFFEFVASPRGRQILADIGYWVAVAPPGG